MTLANWLATYTRQRPELPASLLKKPLQRCTPGELRRAIAWLRFADRDAWVASRVRDAID